MTASAFSVDSWRLHRDMGYIFTTECTSLTDLHYFSTYIPGLIWCCKPFLMCIYTEELFVFVWGDIHGLLRNWQNRSYIQELYTSTMVYMLYTYVICLGYIFYMRFYYWCRSRPTSALPFRMFLRVLPAQTKNLHIDSSIRKLSCFY